MSKRILNFRYLRKLCHSIYPEKFNTLRNINIAIINGTVGTLSANQLRNFFILNSEILHEAKKVDIDIENDLRKACEEGELAVLNLMNQLKELVITASSEYRKCIQKQIELVKASEKSGGPLSELWDNMPEYRTLADDLNKELHEYLVLFKLIGDITLDHSLLAFENNISSFENLSKQYKNLELLVLVEFEENKKLEVELLKVKKDNILKSLEVFLRIMSSEKGNTSRTRPQKHRNKTAFKNTLHDTSHRTKMINTIQVCDVCTRCKEIIEWKIKFKKYKPLTQPKKCVKCEQKSVKKAYHVMCDECGKKLGVCAKCCQVKEIIQAQIDEKQQAILDNEMKALLQSLPERKRRTFLRYVSKQNSQNVENKTEGSLEDTKNKLIKKLNDLKIEDESGGFSDELSDIDDSDED